MSIYKKYTIKVIESIQTYNVYVAVYGLRYHIQTTAKSEKEATKNAVYRLSNALFPGKSKASGLIDIRSNNPIFHYRRPENWDEKTIKEVS
jgi:hypothetical protein